MRSKLLASENLKFSDTKVCWFPKGFVGADADVDANTDAADELMSRWVNEQMLMLMLWPLAVTPRVTNVRALCNFLTEMAMIWLWGVSKALRVSLMRVEDMGVAGLLELKNLS